MNILHIYHGVYSHRGVETYLKTLVSLFKEEHKQFLAVPKGKYNEIGLGFDKVFEIDKFSDIKKICESENINIIHCHYTGPETFYKHKLHRYRKGKEFLITIEKLNENDNELNPENHPYGFVNIFQFFETMVYDETLKKNIINKNKPKIVINTHTEDPLPSYLMYPCIDAIIHVSKKLKKINKKNKVAHEVIYPAIDLNKFSSKKRKENKRLKVGFVGSIEKFNAAFMEEIKKENYKEFDFIFFGENKGFKNKENIFFLGKVDDIHKHLNDLDVFLYPSTRDALSIAVQEAMAMSLPIIATSIISELVNKVGIILDDPENLFNVLHDLKDKKLRQYLGEKSRKKAINFSLLKFKRNYSDLYNRLA